MKDTSLKDWMNKHIPGGRFIKTHGSQLLSGEPDILGCLQGRMVAFEVKRPGEPLRPQQASVLRKWAAVGAVTGRVEDAADVLQALWAAGWNGKEWTAG